MKRVHSEYDADQGQTTLNAVGRSIGIAAVIIMLGNLTSSALGFVRQSVMLGTFGASSGTDAFIAASIVPQMFYDLAIGAAISAALIPTFASILEGQGKDALWRLFSAVLTLAWLVLTIVVILLIILAHPLMSLILWGFHAHHLGAGPFNLSIEIVRILVPSLFFLGTSAILLSALYSLRRFTVPAFASTFYHLGIIGGALFLARPLGVLALPVGALAGAAAQTAVQIPPLIRSGVRLRVYLEFTPEVRQIIRLYAPVAAGLTVSIAGQVIDMSFKSVLPYGSITDMAAATQLTQFPIGIAVAALSFAVLPSISADAAFGRIDRFKDTLARGMRLVLFLTIPAAIGYMVLATPIIALLFQHHAFGPRDTSQASLALVGYAIQIPFVGVDQLLIFSFYARKNTITPMLVGVIGVGIYVASALILMPTLHILGLALANTIQNSLHGLILLGLLFSGIGTLEGRGVMQAVGKALAGALVMAVGAALAASRLQHLGVGGHAIDALIPIVVGVTLYLGVAAVLRSDELNLVYSLARRRLAQVG